MRGRWQLRGYCSDVMVQTWGCRQAMGKNDVMIYDVVMSAGVGLGPSASQRAKMTENRWNNGGGQRDGVEGAAQRV